MIDKSDLENLLALSRLKIQNEEQARLIEQMGDIIDYFELLQGYDTSRIDVDLGESVPIGSLRPDSVSRDFKPERIESFAIELDAGHFSVPRILGDEENG